MTGRETPQERSTGRRRRPAAQQRRIIAERRRVVVRERRLEARRQRRGHSGRPHAVPVATFVAVPTLMLTAGAGVASADYEVRGGETLTGIARQHGTTVAALVKLNELDDPDRILIGQRLKLPTEPEATATAPDRAEAGALIERVARDHGWSPAFVKAIAWQESGWNNQRVSPAGAIGIMQVMPDTGRFVSQHLVGRDLDLDDPQDNVLAGVTFLQYLWELTDGDVEMTLAGYYQGLASVRDNGMYDSTERYIANVLALRERFR